VSSEQPSCHEWNTATHVADHEGRPQRRPLSRVELQRLFDVCDEGVEVAAGARRKGWLAAFRDATMFKTIYGWGLRRTETAKLDVTDFSTNPAAPQLGGLGVCHVRFGKAQRGSPRRRAVATVMAWTGEALGQYLAEVRPRYGVEGHPAVWLTERGGRIALRPSPDPTCEGAETKAFRQFQYPTPPSNGRRRREEPDAHRCALAGVRRRRRARRRHVKPKVGYRWHLRRLMAEQGMFQTTELVPLLAERGVELSREQVYRLAVKTPQRLNLEVLAALCDILDCDPGDLIECHRDDAGRRASSSTEPATSPLPRPRRARVARDGPQA